MTTVDLALETDDDCLKIIPRSDLGSEWLDREAPPETQFEDGVFVFSYDVGRDIAERAFSDGLQFFETSG